MRAPDDIGKNPLSALLIAAVALLNLFSSSVIADDDASGAESMVTDTGIASDGIGVMGDSAVADQDVIDSDGTEDGGANEATLTSEVVPPEESFIELSARAFNEFELLFVRGLSNAPFLPVAFLGNTRFGDAMVSVEGATPETAGTRYNVNSTSQYAGVLFLLNKRSMVVLGEYVSYSNFSVDNGEDFSVASATLGAGYTYLVNND